MIQPLTFETHIKVIIDIRKHDHEVNYRSNSPFRRNNQAVTAAVVAEIPR